MTSDKQLLIWLNKFKRLLFFLSTINLIINLNIFVQLIEVEIDSEEGFSIKSILVSFVILIINAIIITTILIKCRKIDTFSNGAVVNWLLANLFVLIITDITYLVIVFSQLITDEKFEKINVILLLILFLQNNIEFHSFINQLPQEFKNIRKMI